MHCLIDPRRTVIKETTKGTWSLSISTYTDTGTSTSTSTAKNSAKAARGTRAGVHIGLTKQCV